MLHHARQAAESASQQSQRADDAELRAHQTSVQALVRGNKCCSFLLWLKVCSATTNSLCNDWSKCREKPRDTSKPVRPRSPGSDWLRHASQGDCNSPSRCPNACSNCRGYEPFADGSHVAQILEAISSDRVNANETSGQNSAVPIQQGNRPKDQWIHLHMRLEIQSLHLWSVMSIMEAWTHSVLCQV